MRSTRDQTSGATRSEARRIEAPYARAGVGSAVLATSVANRGTSLASAAARRVGRKRARFGKRTAPPVNHIGHRAAISSSRRCVRITSTYSLSRK
ncbi:hypothetical protein MTO96_001006 [Rhipicephalus appendiculatus]